MEDLIGLCTVISDYCLLLQLKSWGMRGAYNHSAPWVLAGLLVTRFIVLTTLWMKEMTWVGLGDLIVQSFGGNQVHGFG